MGFLQQTTASALVAIATFLAWQWFLPMIQQISQRPIQPQLERLAALGVCQQRLSLALLMGEAIVLTLWITTTVTYMGLTLGVVVLVILYHSRGLVLTWIVDRRERILRQQTLAFTTGLHGLTQSGMTAAQAIMSIAHETPAPLGRHIQRIANNYRLGRPLEEAIADVRALIRLDAFSLLATSITCAFKKGGSMADSLVGVQESLEHRDQVERQLSAKTSSARMTILILSCTPFGFFLMFFLMMPNSMALIFETDTGKMMLAAIIGILYAGVAWARMLLRLK